MRSHAADGVRTVLCPSELAGNAMHKDSECAKKARGESHQMYGRAGGPASKQAAKSSSRRRKEQNKAAVASAALLAQMQTAAERVEKAAAIAHLSLARLAHGQCDVGAARDHLGSAKALDARGELGLHDLITRVSHSLGLGAGSA